MKTIAPVRLLKLALYADAAASAALAGGQLLFAALLADHLSLPALLLTESGVFLVAYVVMLLCLAGMARVWAAAIQFVVIGNALWALGCLALAFTPLVSPSALGIAFLMLQAIAVLVFAGMQRAGLRASIDSAPARDQRSVA
ncbi:MAG: hypothetical protein WKG03_01025 [Telluria sp.]